MEKYCLKNFFNMSRNFLHKERVTTCQSGICVIFRTQFEDGKTRKSAKGFRVPANKNRRI